MQNELVVRAVSREYSKRYLSLQYGFEQEWMREIWNLHELMNTKGVVIGLAGKFKPWRNMATKDVS